MYMELFNNFFLVQVLCSTNGCFRETQLSPIPHSSLILLATKTVTSTLVMKTTQPAENIAYSCLNNFAHGVCKYLTTFSLVLPVLTTARQPGQLLSRVHLLLSVIYLRDAGLTWTGQSNSSLLNHLGELVAVITRRRHRSCELLPSRQGKKIHTIHQSTVCACLRLAPHFGPGYRTQTTDRSTISVALGQPATNNAFLIWSPECARERFSWSRPVFGTDLNRSDLVVDFGKSAQSWGVCGRIC